MLEVSAEAEVRFSSSAGGFWGDGVLVRSSFRQNYSAFQSRERRPDAALLTFPLFVKVEKTRLNAKPDPSFCPHTLACTCTFAGLASISANLSDR